MTAISRPITRETAAIERGRAITLTLYPKFMEFHEKGRRYRYPLTYGQAYDCARKLWARREKALEAQTKPRVPRGAGKASWRAGKMILLERKA